MQNPNDPNYFNQQEYQDYANQGTSPDYGISKDLLTIQLEIGKLKKKIFNILKNQIANPEKKGGFLSKGKQFLTDEGINHIMVTLDTNLDSNTLLSDLTEEQIYNIIMLIMRSIGQGMVFNPLWNVESFDKFDAVFDNVFTSLYITLLRAKGGFTSKQINTRYEKKVFESVGGNF